MCGIAGAFALKGDATRWVRAVEQANEQLVLRGPDGGAVYQKGKAALGHRRLSIIDVSCAGDQPMHSPDGRYSIVFNGEILNFESLRDQYLNTQERAALRSHSDTEVFLHLYMKMGTACFLLLRGFFAAAIYDHEQEELVLVRDRFGKKPLLYHRDEDRVIFASEMKALLAAGVPKKMNLDVLPLYFQLNYIPLDYSLVEGVKKLPQGRFLRIRGEEVNEEVYYQLKLHPQEYSSLTYEQAQSTLVNLMDDAVRARMIADVPLGAFLSGGIDSSVVVALASRHTSQLNTFSIGYKDHPFFDETSFAKLVADKYKTNHTVFSLGNDDFLEHVLSVMNYLDEPFADSSAIPEYILCHHTRKHVTVALSGDGGDEVFAGYNKHAAEYRIRQRGILNTLVKSGHEVWDRLPKSRNGKLANLIRQLHRFSTGARLSDSDRYWRWAGFMDTESALGLFHTKVRSGLDLSISAGAKHAATACIMADDFNSVLLADMNMVLLSDMLVKVDLMSMANSLEVRSPFLDAGVVDFAFGLPAHFKINSRMKKRIVQDAFRDMLPQELYNRPKKGFEIPLLDWFRKELWSLINDDLLEDRFIEEQEIFNPHSIRQLKARLHSANPGDSHATIWALLVFQHWWKQYMQ